MGVVEVSAWGGLGYLPCGHPCFVDITGGCRNCCKAQEEWRGDELPAVVFLFFGWRRLQQKKKEKKMMIKERKKKNKI
jgi:hypothetical protein